MIFLRILNTFLSWVDRIFFNPVTVLVYHSVSDGNTPISISAENFRSHMDFLKTSGAKVLDLGQFLELKSGRLRPVGRSVLITFDDGFKDVFSTAFPILKEYGFPAVIFINPGLLGKKAIFASNGKDRLRDICSLEDLHKMADEGIAIANHGYSHKSFADLPTADAFSEFEKSEEFIRDNFSRNNYPNIFVFPKGAGNEVIISGLNKRGATVIGERTDIYSNTFGFRFVVKLSSFYSWLRQKLFA